MKINNLLPILFVALCLATAWAIRGQFGHEQGAAWAGAIGGTALVIASGREDWYPKMLLVALASAIGWGAGGMISYGRIVGYGRADDFLNAYYGLGMLFVIGGLFGLLGGGLVGLVLDSTEEKKVKWGNLMAEMTAGGILCYYFLIEQIGFKMTPPRSEAWAVILGAGMAMIWHMARENRIAPLRVAMFATLGGGLGFAFGNFLQIVGNVLEIPFNMWNVMEYCIGFMGGTGMAYGVFSSKWPHKPTPTKPWCNKAALVFLIVFIPLIVFRESLAYSHMLRQLGASFDVEKIATASTAMAALLLLAMALLLWVKLNPQKLGRSQCVWFLFGLLGTYTAVSYLVSGLLIGDSPINHHLYVLNILAVAYILGKMKMQVSWQQIKTLPENWIWAIPVVLVMVAFLALIAIGIHGELPGANERF